jgi:hypothetical protein
VLFEGVLKMLLELRVKPIFKMIVSMLSRVIARFLVIVAPALIGPNEWNCGSVDGCCWRVQV